MLKVWLLRQKAYSTTQDSNLLTPVNYSSLILKPLHRKKQKGKNLHHFHWGLFTEEQPARISQFSETIDITDKHDIAGCQQWQKHVSLSCITRINGDAFWAQTNHWPVKVYLHSMAWLGFNYPLTVERVFIERRPTWRVQDATVSSEVASTRSCREASTHWSAQFD